MKASRVLLDRPVAGRRWTVRLSKRTPERRAVDWAGIGPARSGATAGYGGLTHPGDLVGVAVHAGPWLLVVLAMPMGIRR